MKVRQNGQWKNVGGIDVGRIGNYTLLTPEMISGTLGDNSQRYIGTATHLIIDDSFQTNSLNSLFRDNQTLKSLVILTNKITDMTNIFNSIGSQFESLFINTSNVIDMTSMFNDSQATSLDLSSFDTSKVTDMTSMFNGSQATTLDLSSFDTSKVTDMTSMFNGSQATIGYARTQADADRFNASSGKPAGLVFVVKGT